MKNVFTAITLMIETPDRLTKLDVDIVPALGINKKVSNASYSNVSLMIKKNLMLILYTTKYNLFYSIAIL